MRTDRWRGVFAKVKGIRGHTGFGGGGIEGEDASFMSPELRPLFVKGDILCACV